tara:strand:- start:4718 stop:5065 length:348 start_codon:yes stop_codon:yes gene_type:complete
MSYIITSETELSRIAAPSLPLATKEYNQQYIDQLNNVLRLYFNRLDNLLAQLVVSGIIPATTNYTVATLPSAVTSGVGARSFVTDASGPTFGATVAGGGAVKVPVYSDGTNWKVG